MIPLQRALAGMASASALFFIGALPVSASDTQPQTVQTVIYGAGTAWQANVPPEKQLLGPHFGYVQQLFDRRRLMANGPLADGRGLYIYRATAAEAKMIVADDPGRRSGVIKPLVTASWTLIFDQLGLDTGEKKLYVLDYAAGPAFDRNVPFDRQHIGDHIAYVTKAFENGTVLAGGPVDSHSGRYIIAVSDEAAVQAFLENDPGVRDRIFAPSVSAWHPLQPQ